MSDEDARARRARRTFFAPEAIQTSAMDCGPACLKTVLAGYRVPVSYGRLREACHTSVDGTSVSALEAVLRDLGLEASEVVVPAEHLVLARADLLPAIVVTTQPSGILHFVVVWRVVGPFAQVMDPARGRHWVSRRELLRRIAVVDVPVPREAFEAFVAEPSLRPVLLERLRSVGCPDAARVLDAALAEGWQGFVRLEGALRFAERLRADAGFGAGEAGRVLGALHAAAARDAAAIPEALLAAKPAPDGEEPDEAGGVRTVPMVKLRGAVAIAIEGVRAQAVEAAPAESAGTAAARRALGSTDERAGRVLWRLLLAAGRARPALVVLGLVMAALGALVETLLFRGFFDLGRRLPLVSHRVAAVFAVAVFAFALLLVEWPTALGIAALGRKLEGGLRRAFLDKLPRLEDAYFQSRPVSDMATRAHQIHQLRALPFYGGQLVRVACELVVTTAGVIWLHPRGAVLALLLFASLLALPLFAQGGHEERDMRVRAHAGALSVFYLDALLGLSAVRAHAGEAALLREHGTRLEEWARAAWQAVRHTVRAEAFAIFVGYALALLLLYDHVVGARGSGWALLLVYWTLSMPALGQELTFLLQQIPRQKNLTLRLVEPLAAAEVLEAGAELPKGTADGASPGLALSFRGVRVEAGGHEVLALDELDIAPGSHVAIVGASGSGKSSLLGLVLGWHRAAAGEVLHDGRRLDAAALAALRAKMVWVDPSVQLWNRSLLDNLRYGSPAQDAPVGAAVEDAELDEVLARLPTGLESPLGEGGALLSGGEGQRVRYGRAVHRAGARLVVFDEPFRGLERERRQRLLARARQRFRDATFLCATHDVGDTAVFDRVLVIGGGRVVEDGTPAELAATPQSIYASFLAVERRLQHVFDDAVWRRWRIEGGRVTEADDAPASREARA